MDFKHDQDSRRFLADALLRNLTYREREVIKLRCGFNDGNIYSLAEVGRIFKMTIARVRHLESKGFLKLLKNPESRQVFESILPEKKLKQMKL